MGTIALLSNAELLGRLPLLVRAEQEATADVIEHLLEVERRRLYLEQACSSLNKYCEERLGYAEDAASKRARVAKLALVFSRTLEELRSGAIHRFVVGAETPSFRAGRKPIRAVSEQST